MSKGNNPKVIMVRVQTFLLEDLRKKFPEVKGLTNTGIVDFAIRYLLKEKKQP